MKTETKTRKHIWTNNPTLRIVESIRNDENSTVYWQRRVSSHCESWACSKDDCSDAVLGLAEILRRKHYSERKVVDSDFYRVNWIEIAGYMVKDHLD